MREKKTVYVTREVPVDSSSNMLIGFVGGILFGALGGYVLGMQATPAAIAGPAAVTTAAASPAISDTEVQAYKNVLAADPKNAQAAIEIGNRLYDAKRFTEAIPYYQQAMTLKPGDINVSTDLGTALWNAGRADDALAQFEQSLRIDPKHPQTLFNIGVVRLNGKRDPAGAIAAWDRLLASNPGYTEQEKVRQMIAEARSSLEAASLVNPRASSTDAGGVISLGRGEPSSGRSRVVATR